jgi:hypothetical protein
MTYTGLAFPKPKVKKGNSRRAKNNPVPTIYDRCAICGQPYASLHEVFYGTKNRQNSIDYGMQIRLCIYHHQVGPDAVHNNPEFNQQLKEKYQRIFERQHGHNKFIEVFGENFIDESEWVFMDE